MIPHVCLIVTLVSMMHVTAPYPGRSRPRWVVPAFWAGIAWAFLGILAELLL